MTPSANPRRHQRLGAAGERAVADWYRRRGYRELARNWRCREGELDLVLYRRGVVVFCEVKTRSSRRFGHPVEAVTATKQERIRRLAMAFLAEHGTGTAHPGLDGAADLRFDVAAVEGRAVEVWKAAF